MYEINFVESCLINVCSHPIMCILCDISFLADSLLITYRFLKSNDFARKSYDLKGP